MQFDEQTATEIVTKFSLDEKTIKVWRNRDAIPDRYFREGFVIKQKADGERDEQFLRDFQKILNFKKIRTIAIFRLAGITDIRAEDIVYKNIISTKEELLALKKAINVLRIEAREIMSLFAKIRMSEQAQVKLKLFLKRNEIVTNRLFDKEYAGKLRDWCLGKCKFPSEYENEIIHALGVFITETNMM